MKREVKQGLTHRLRQRVGMADTDTDTDSDEEKKTDSVVRKKWGRRRLIGGGKEPRDIEEGTEDSDTIKESHGSGNELDSPPARAKEAEAKEESIVRKKSIERARSTIAGLSILEQSMPADAVLAKAGAAEVKFAFDDFGVSTLIMCFSFCKALTLL